MEELNRSLSLSLTKKFPEEYIRKALIAHGFFNHAPTDKSRESRPAAACGISEEDRKRTTQLVSHFKEGREFHALKEPRHLYDHFQSRRLQGNFSVPYWPSEVECIRERPVFIHSTPQCPEPFCVSDQAVETPRIKSSDGLGTTVYTNSLGPEKYFTTTRAGPSLTLPPIQLSSSADISLHFESRFESGNLCKAVQVGKWDYELYIRYDLYTKKHTQWFFFRVRNMQAGQTYRFTIVNLYKARSLYSEGMQPVFYSEKRAKEQNVGWHRVGFNIKYFKTTLRRPDMKQEAYFYGLTWSYMFQYSEDTCFFAHCYPYTYSDLQDYLHSMLSDREKAKFCKHKVLCYTLAGNSVPLITITSPALSPQDIQTKRGVVVTARVHPGETNGSWMMKGLLDFLTGPSDDAKILRDLFVFKIVPMLNPDGVVIGNYRCSLAGKDLNRNYCSKMRDSYPTVWHTKAMVKKFCKERKVVLYCDLHGHSRKQNIFVYGCDSLDDPVCRLKSRVFPCMLFKNAPCKFSFKSSKFMVQKCKEGTGRVVMWREAGIQNSYTLEATFSGSTQGKLKGLQFSITNLEEMGYHLCDTLLDYCDPDQSKTKQIMTELEDELRQKVMAALASLGQELPPGVDPLDIPLNSAMIEDCSSDGGSDSSVSDGPPVHLQWKESKPKKKKLKSHKERNKQKALLKMKHQVQDPLKLPIHEPILFSHDSTTELACAREEGEKEQKVRLQSSTKTPSALTSLDSAHNGGIPTFIQERLEQRQRRKVEHGTKQTLEQEFSCTLGAVTPEQLKNALLQIQAESSLMKQATISTLFQPYSLGSMSISQVKLLKGLKEQSKNSDVCLPQIHVHAANSGILFPPAPEVPSVSLPQSIINHSHGTFTSRYVASHIQLPANPDSSCIATSPSHELQNVSSLAHLFCQPCPPQSPRKELVPHSVTTKHEEIDSEVEDLKKSQAESSDFSEKKNSLHELMKKEREENDSDYTSHQVAMLSSTQDRVSTDVHSTSQLNESQSVSPNQNITYKWKNFSTSVMPKAKHRRKKERVDKETNSKREKRGSENRAAIEGGKVETNTVTMDATQFRREKEDWNGANTVALKKNLYPPLPQPLPNTSVYRTPSYSDTIISTHKKGIADAVETMHTRRHFGQHGTSRNIICVSKSDPLPSSSKSSPYYPPPQLKQTHPDSDILSRKCERRFGRNEAVRSEMVTRGYEPWNENTRASNDQSKTQPPATSSATAPHSVYSSKCVSRSGSRPGPDNGIPPATVSIMLAQGSRKKPATTQGSRRPKHPYIQFYTSKTS